jgi:hypothetical protein
MTIQLAAQPLRATDLASLEYPSFPDVDQGRLHRKQRLPAAFRVFGKLGFDEALPATSPLATPSCPTTSGSTLSVSPFPR